MDVNSLPKTVTTRLPSHPKINEYYNISMSIHIGYIDYVHSNFDRIACIIANKIELLYVSTLQYTRSFLKVE